MIKVRDHMISQRAVSEENEKLKTEEEKCLKSAFSGCKGEIWCQKNCLNKFKRIISLHIFSKRKEIATKLRY